MGALLRLIHHEHVVERELHPTDRYSASRIHG